MYRTNCDHNKSEKLFIVKRFIPLVFLSRGLCSSCRLKVIVDLTPVQRHLVSTMQNSACGVRGSTRHSQILTMQTLLPFKSIFGSLCGRPRNRLRSRVSRSILQQHYCTHNSVTSSRTMSKPRSQYHQWFWETSLLTNVVVESKKNACKLCQLVSWCTTTSSPL